MAKGSSAHGSAVRSGVFLGQSLMAVDARLDARCRRPIDGRPSANSDLLLRCREHLSVNFASNGVSDRDKPTLVVLAVDAPTNAGRNENRSARTGIELCCLVRS